MKNKKATINPINKKDDRFFQYAVTVSLSYKEIGKCAKRILKVKSFINKYNWEGVNYPSEKNDLEKFEKNNITVALNVLYAKKEKIYAAYVSKHNSNHEKEVTLLMTSNGEERAAKSEGRRWHYLPVKKLSALLRGITSKHHGDFCCQNCFHSFATKNKLESHKRACKNKDFCNIRMQSNYL